MKNWLELLLKNKYALVLFALLFVHITNMFIDVMEVDAAQYASISMEMFQSKSYLQVFQHGQDYLDKPPLLFWLNCISFTVFGISNFSYKFFAVLSLFLGLFGTYKFARLYYSRDTARYAALILCSSQAYFLMTNDVRADGLLTAWVIISVWLLSDFLQRQKLKYLVLGALATALAMMAKGPIAFIAVVIALGADMLLKKQWKNIFRWEWILFIVVVGVALWPMCYGLYTQFDLHPEKVVYDLHGPSGLRFFFWTQSFGRITGEIYWNNHAPATFFLQTILWDYQPWVVLLFAAIGYFVINLLQNKFKSSILPEFSSITAFVLLFLMLSMSNYKLPHYIFLIFPFASILVAHFLQSISAKIIGRFAIFQMVTIHLFFILLGINFIFFFPPSNFLLPLFCVLMLGSIWFFYRKLEGVPQLIFPTLLTAIAFNLVLSLNFYPNILQYQSTSTAGHWLKEHRIPSNEVRVFNATGFALDFYSGKTPATLDQEKINELPSGILVYTDESGAKDLMNRSVRFQVLKEFPSYHVTNLKLDFLLKSKRPIALSKAFILKYQ